MSSAIDQVLNKHLVRSKRPAFRTGDTLSVQVKVREGDRERLQAFEGVVIKRRRRTNDDASFTLQKHSYGVCVIRTFPLYSPNIVISVKRRGKVRQATLHHMIGVTGRRARIPERISKHKVKKG